MRLIIFAASLAKRLLKGGTTINTEISLCLIIGPTDVARNLFRIRDRLGF